MLITNVCQIADNIQKDYFPLIKNNSRVIYLAGSVNGGPVTNR